MDLSVADLRASRDAVIAHRRIQAQHETALGRWLKKHRGVPAHVLYDPDGHPLDPDLAALEAAVDAAVADVKWCRSVEVAVAEVVKGEPLETVMARNEANRERLRARLADRTG